jgi:CMP-N,N'-diacetyllegionaminic acid synthase
MVEEQYGKHIEMMKIWAIIPARSGSKGLKNKNIRKLKNKPLIYYTIKVAKESKLFEKIFLLTDSIKYAKLANRYGAETPYIRPKFNATDKSTDNDLYVYLYKFLKKKKIKTPDYFAHLSPTVPLRNKKIIINGINYFFKNKKSNLYNMRSVSLFEPNAYKMCRVINGKICSILRKDFDANKINYPRQFYDKTYKPNGIIDIVSLKNLEKNQTIYNNKTLAFITNKLSVDIDNLHDLKWANYIFKNK